MILNIQGLPQDVNMLIQDYWLPHGYKKMKDIIHELPKSGSVAMERRLKRHRYLYEYETGVSPSARALWSSDHWKYWLLDGQWRRDNGKYSFFQNNGNSLNLQYLFHNKK